MMLVVVSMLTRKHRQLFYGHFELAFIFGQKNEKKNGKKKKLTKRKIVENIEIMENYSTRTGTCSTRLGSVSVRFDSVFVLKDSQRTRREQVKSRANLQHTTTTTTATIETPFPLATCQRNERATSAVEPMKLPLTSSAPSAESQLERKRESVHKQLAASVGESTLHLSLSLSVSMPKKVMG